MEILLEAHEFAWSMRTSGFPLIVYSQEEKRLVEFRTEKRARVLSLPDEAKYLAWFYSSNSGKRSVKLYSLPNKKLLKTWDESDAQTIMQLAPSDLNSDIKRWILG
jgi:hypothetical protein